MDRTENKDLEKKKGPNHKSIKRESEGWKKEEKDARNERRHEQQNEENKKREEVNRNMR